jgi:hypothetical protein
MLTWMPATFQSPWFGDERGELACPAGLLIDLGRALVVDDPSAQAMQGIHGTQQPRVSQSCRYGYPTHSQVSGTLEKFDEGSFRGHAAEATGLLVLFEPVVLPFAAIV